MVKIVSHHILNISLNVKTVFKNKIEVDFLF